MRRGIIDGFETYLGDRMAIEASLAVPDSQTLHTLYDQHPEYWTARTLMYLDSFPRDPDKVEYHLRLDAADTLAAKRREEIDELRQLIGELSNESTRALGIMASIYDVVREDTMANKRYDPDQDQTPA